MSSEKKSIDKLIYLHFFVIQACNKFHYIPLADAFIKSDLQVRNTFGSYVEFSTFPKETSTGELGIKLATLWGKDTLSISCATATQIMKDVCIFIPLPHRISILGTWWNFSV